MQRIAHKVIATLFLLTSVSWAQSVFNPGSSAPSLNVLNFGVDNSGATDTTTNFQNALNACNGNTLTVPAGTYKLQTVTISHPCTLYNYSLQGAHLVRNSSTLTSNITVGWIQIASSNVNFFGLEIDCNNGSFTGHCIVASGAYSSIRIRDNYIHNDDGAAIMLSGSSTGGPSPSFVEISGNYMVAGAASATAFNLITMHDCSHDVDVHDNPMLDGSLESNAGAATLQLESQGLTCAMYNIDIHSNPHVICAADWCIQAGGFNAYSMYGIRAEDNGGELAYNSAGFISIPVSINGKIISGNHLNTHFADALTIGADGSTTASTNAFNSATIAFLPNAVGRTLVYVCSGTVYTAMVATYVSATQVTLSVTPVCTGSSEAWQFFGWSATYTAIEGGMSQGSIITNNVCYCESNSSLIGIIMDGSADATITGNTITGFGEAGGVGIKVSSGLASQVISGAVSEVGNLVTVNMGAALGGQLQPGIILSVCASAPPCAQSTYFGRVQVVNANYNRTAGTFSYYVPATGVSCASSCGTVYMGAYNNIVAHNVIHFPSLLPVSGNLNGLQVQTLTASSQDVFNNTFDANTVIEHNTGQAGTFCLAQTGTPTSIDNTVWRQNDCEGENVGMQYVIGTNAHLINNSFHNVNTIFNYTAGTVAESTQPIPLADYVACGATYNGLSGMISNGAATPVYNATAASGSTVVVRMVCNGTNWVNQ